MLRERESDAVIAAIRGYVDDGVALYSLSLAWIEIRRAIRTRADEESPTTLADYADAALSGIVQVGGRTTWDRQTTLD